jgi:acylphosphatase
MVAAGDWSQTCPDLIGVKEMAGAVRGWVYPAVIVVLLLVIAAMAYKFIVAGSVQQAEDGRVEILLEPGERDLMLREMRAFVESLQLMSDALSRDDMAGVAKAARAMGTAKAHDVPLSMIAKLPLEFKTLAFGVHGGFDAIANDAETMGMPKHTLAQLSEVLQQCVACHSGYQLKIPVAK